MSLFFRVRAFDVKGLFVVVFGTWFSNFGFICSKNRKGERSFECRMAPLTELIIQCLHTACDHPEPKHEPRPSSPHSEGKSLMQAGGVLFCIFCSETIFLTCVSVNFKAAASSALSGPDKYFWWLNLLSNSKTWAWEKAALDRFFLGFVCCCGLEVEVWFTSLSWFSVVN